MKYQRLVSNTTPASLQDWLEEELESRGIDGVYTRYILSLLQQDYLDLEPSECQHTKLTGHHRKINDQYGCKDYVLSFSKARRQKLRDLEKTRLFGSTTPCCGFDFALNLEERNKNAAVECLKSASEEKIDVEKLVEEVCIKLKNVKTITSEENTGESKIELNDQVEKVLEEIMPSSPKDQAEKYYAAFPALNGKTEPMTELCLQQNKTDSVVGGPWNGKLNKEIVDEKFEQDNMHDSSFGNCTLEITSKSIESNPNSTEILEHPIKEFRVIDQDLKRHDESEKKQGPSFIVPKMKSSKPRKPLSVRYLPFNQPLKQASDIALAKDLAHLGNADLLIADFDTLNTLNLTVLKERSIREEECRKNLHTSTDSLPTSSEDFDSSESEKSHTLEDGSDQENAFESMFEGFCDCEKLGILMCAALTDVTNSGLCDEDNLLIEKLLSKFNSSLAAIWGTNDQGTNACKSISEGSGGKLLELSSIEANDLSESVWTYKKENLDENVDAVKLTSLALSYTPPTPSSKDTPELLCEDNDVDSDATTIELTDSLPRDVQVSLDFEDENLSSDMVSECILNEFLEDCLVEGDESPVEDSTEDVPVICPRPCFPVIDKINTSHFADTTVEKDIAIVKSDLNSTPGFYSLWHSASDPSQALDQNLKKIWDPSPLDECSNWLVLPVGNKAQRPEWESKDFLALQPNAQVVWEKGIECESKTTNPLLSKEKCTLTYHKGESKFVEVIPSHKQKLNIIEDYAEGESRISFQSGSALSNVVYLEYLSDDDYEEENLLTSPKTHFQPIRQDSLDTDNSDDLEVMMLTHKGLGSSPNMHHSLGDLSNSGNVHPIGLNVGNSPKQTSRRKIKKIKNKIVSPRKVKLVTPIRESKRKRAISSSLDEMVSLTGHFPGDRSEPDIASHNAYTLDLFHFWKTNNFKDKGTNTDISQFLHDQDGPVKPTAIARPSDRMHSKTYFSSETEMWDRNRYQDTPSQNRNPSEWKWSTNDSSSIGEDLWYQTCAPDWNHVNRLKKKEIAKPFGSNTDVHALRQEIKEEEEELLRDICYVSSTCGEDDVTKPNGIGNIIIGSNKKDFLKTYGKLTQHSLYRGVDNEFIGEETILQHSDFLKWSDSDENFSEDMYPEFYDGSFSLNGLDVEDGSHSCFPSVPADKILYSSDLEDEWRRNSQSFGIQIPQRRFKYKCPPQRRPCSFYLEGNCRRSDCRFSHDLSTITCRFWEEGSCFKGITCPFLHGYIGDVDYHEGDDTPDCNYTLESEADFPSLAAPKTGATQPKSAPQEIILDKGNRPKRKKGRSHSGWNSRKSVQSVVSSSWPGCKSVLDSLEYSPE